MGSRLATLGQQTYLQLFPQLLYIHTLGHFDIAGGLHASAHGHEVWREADEHITASRLSQTLHVSN